MSGGARVCTTRTPLPRVTGCARAPEAPPGFVERHRNGSLQHGIVAAWTHCCAAGTHLVETLRAWLDAFGDVAVAAARVYTHPNTFRYRLRRLSEISGLDLTDPEARFSAMVQLRLLAPRD